MSVRAAGDRAAARGSGFGILKFRRIDNRWRVVLETELLNFDLGTDWCNSTWETVSL